MSYRRRKTEAEIAYDEGVQNIRLRGKQMLDRVINELLAEWTEEHKAAAANNKILYINADDDTLRGLFLRTTQRQLKEKS